MHTVKALFHRDLDPKRVGFTTYFEYGGLQCERGRSVEGEGGDRPAHTTQ